MNDLFVMRRANGDLFTEEVDGRVVLPVWSGRDSVERYRERNPRLMIYFPAPLDAKTLKTASSGQLPLEYFLLEEGDPDADLEEGRMISPDEVLLLTKRSPEFSPKAA
jgi:hypothetical protein